MICSAQNGLATQGNRSWCGIAGSLNHFGWLFGCFAWTAIAVHSAIVVLLRRDRWPRIAMFITYGFIVGVPLLMVIIVVGIKRYGFSQTGNFLCFPDDDDIIWGTYMWFFCAGLLISVVCIGYVIWKSILVSNADFLSIKNNIRVLGFLLIGTIWMVAHIVHRSWMRINRDGWALKQGAWTVCVITNVTPNQCAFPNHISNATLVILLILIYSPTFTILLFFGTNKELWINWKGRISPISGITNATSTTASATTATGASSGSKDSYTSNFMSDLQ